MTEADAKARKILFKYADSLVKPTSYIGLKTFLLQVVHQMRSSLHDVDGMTHFALALAEEYSSPGPNKEPA